MLRPKEVCHNKLVVLDATDFATRDAYPNARAGFCGLGLQWRLKAIPMMTKCPIHTDLEMQVILLTANDGRSSTR
jgi:hypothetical protein